MNYRIGSMNALNLKLNSPKEKFECIAYIIKHNHLDMLAVQEVLSEGKAWGGAGVEAKANERFIKYLLGNNWDCVWDKPHKDNQRTPNDRRDEGFFIIFDKNTFKPVLSKTGEQEAFCIDNGALNFNGLPPLARAPFYGRFVLCSNSMIEFRIINIHLFHGGNDNKISLLTRKEEYKTVVDKIYGVISQKRYGDYHNAYTIVMGDYNLIIPPEEKTIRSEKYIDREWVNSYGQTIINLQTLDTSLHEPLNDENGKHMPDNPYNENFDHFSLDKNYFNKNNIKYTDSRLDISKCVPRKVSSCEISNPSLFYRETVSDHVPIVIDISI